MKRQTAQRRAILDVLQDAPGPLTPQEVLELARSHKRSLGLATVYRNLNALTDEGEVSAVSLPGERTRYEVKERAHHHHFYCRQCDNVFKLTTPCPVDLVKGVTVPRGFQVTHHELTLYGLCPNCQHDTTPL
jgi:Fur family ferric uptake transcriptional regulator